MSKRLFALLFFVAILAIFSTSCSLDGKKHYLDSFGELVAEVEEHGSEYTDDDWLRADQQFRIFSDVYLEKYKDDLSEDDLQRISNYVELFNECRVSVEWEKILNSDF